MSDVDLIINVHTNGVKDITNLSAATRALALNLRGITVPMAKLDSHSRAVQKPSVFNQISSHTLWLFIQLVVQPQLLVES